MKKYKLLSANGSIEESETPGTLGGHSKAKIYGKLDCSAANSALSKGYADHKVFFASKDTPVDAGYRPCGRCMRQEYIEWKAADV